MKHEFNLALAISPSPTLGAFRYLAKSLIASMNQQANNNALMEVEIFQRLDFWKPAQYPKFPPFRKFPTIQ